MPELLDIRGLQSVIPDDGSKRMQVTGFFNSILKWNSKINLTGARDLESLNNYHLPDVLAAAEVLRRTGVKDLIDVGSGNGIPGLVLALLIPGLEVTLLEPRQKRAFFLRHEANRLKLENVRIAEKRAEQITAGLFSAALSRATFKPEEWIHAGKRLIKPNGYILCFTSGRTSPALFRRHFDTVDEFAYKAGPDQRDRRFFCLYDHA